jgi:hypothetical protein
MLKELAQTGTDFAASFNVIPSGKGWKIDQKWDKAG